MKLLPLLGSFIVLAQCHDWTLEGLLAKMSCWTVVSPGHCEDSYEMFGYDPYTGSCRPFIYTGCGGNPNRFQTEMECIHTCKLYDDDLEYDLIFDPDESSNIMEQTGEIADFGSDINQSENKSEGSGGNATEPIITVNYYDIIPPNVTVNEGKNDFSDYDDDNVV